MEEVRKLVKDIKDKLSKQTVSKTDEIKVMKAMLNDKSYEVDVYGKNGIEGTVNPSKEARQMVSSVLKETAKLNKEEADKLADEHNFNDKEAENLVNVSKEFTNTYLESGRKLSLGGRATYGAALKLVHHDEALKEYPHMLGYDDDNNKIWQDPRPTKLVPAHDKIEAESPCPKWIFENKEDNALSKAE